MIKIAHEAPLSIFDKVQSKTDYDYFLVHLFEENEEYLNKAYESVAKGRETILDNSIFELEEAWDGDRFAYWVEKMKPTYYIIPDVLDDCDKTIDAFEKFTKEYSSLPGKTIAVAQGETYENLVRCYKYIAYDGGHHGGQRVDKVAFSFNHPFFQEYPFDGNEAFKMMLGRNDMIERMLKDDIINRNKPHHLLGCGLPQEFKSYTDLKWIDSLDTSNPVVHGIKDIWYRSDGLDDKESVKLFTMMNDDVSKYWPAILYNIREFRRMCNNGK